MLQRRLYPSLMGPRCYLRWYESRTGASCGSLACGSCLLGYRSALHIRQQDRRGRGYQAAMSRGQQIPEVMTVCPWFTTLCVTLSTGAHASSFVNKIWSARFPPAGPLRSGNISPCRAARCNREPAQACTLRTGYCEDGHTSSCRIRADIEPFEMV